MVVKPLDFIATSKNKLLQPAVKCRGREYLRIIYGAEYTTAEHLEDLRQRSVSLKRSLALREFALGIEGFERFVNRAAAAKNPRVRVWGAGAGERAGGSEAMKSHTRFIDRIEP